MIQPHPYSTHGSLPPGTSRVSIGFLPPLGTEEAAQYWHGVIDALRTPNRILVIAQHDGAIAGTVQLNHKRTHSAWQTCLCAE
ncbi:MAG: hypothetical protein M1546_21620 [Chloroflexi bacterium]|nr:hypothetical protein [Chloroflexota bacterium]